MKLRLIMLYITITGTIYAQNLLPMFTVSPNPICTGQQVQVTDVSQGNPVSWSYSVQPQGFGPFTPPPTTFAVQNPSFVFNQPGTYTISLIISNGNQSSPKYSQTFTVLQGPNANITPNNVNTCIGGNTVGINVQTGGGPGTGPLTYSWSNGSNTSSISVSPSVSTIYTCVISSTNGCSIVRTASVSVSNPSVSITGLPSSICPGNPAFLLANTSGPAPYTYTWSNNLGNASSISTSVAGVYQVTVTNGLNCTGTQSYNLISSPNISINVVSNPSVLCQGNSATLTASGAATYTWDNSSNSPNISVSPTVNTTYTVVGSYATCNGTAVITISTAINPTLSISTSTNGFCRGNSATLSISGASSYTWQAPVSGSSNSVVISPNATTTYSVRGANPGCPFKTASITINVLPSPVIQVSSNYTQVCVGEPVALVASGANTYTWNTGLNTPIIIVTPTATTVYSVSSQNTNGCSATASITIIASICEGLAQNKIAALKLYPQPAHSILYIDSPLKGQITLLDLQGRIHTQMPLEIGHNNLTLAGLQAGYYLLRINSETGLQYQGIYIY